MRQLVYYVAASVDGFIADSDGDVSRFPVAAETLTALFERYPETCPTHLRETLGVTAAPRRFDTVLMGSRTFAPALDAGLPQGAYPHLRQLVVTRRSPVAGGAVQTLDGDLAARVGELKRQEGRDIWLCGGGDVAGQLADEIDELQVKVNPVLLGSGVPLFGDRGMPRDLTCTEVSPLPGGVVLLTYRLSAGRPG